MILFIPDLAEPKSGMREAVSNLFAERHRRLDAVRSRSRCGKVDDVTAG